jgi:hypothetical protein
MGTVGGDVPAEDTRTEAELAQQKLENEKETKIIEKTNQRLKDLSPNDQIYEAMENFLLGDPESQLETLGEPSEIIRQGDEAKGKNEDLIARAQYETAAKVAIYNQNPELTKKSLELAGSVTSPTDRHARMQKTILANLDQIIGIAKDYYRTKEIVKTETEAEIAAAANEKKE